MAYTINLTNGAIFATIPDGTRNTDSSLVIIGKNYTGYGEFIGENFVKILESGANTSAPLNPLTGQLWYDLSEPNLKIYDGLTFKTIGTTISSATIPPVDARVVGDMWYDTIAEQLKIFDGTDYEIVGPLYTAANGKTGPVVEILTDIGANEHVATVTYNEGEVVAISHKDSAFELQTPIPGFAGLIYPGIQLATSVLGETPQFTGTATNAVLLNNVPATGYLSSLNNDTTAGTLGVLNDGGLVVGEDSDLEIKVIANDTYITNNTTSGNMFIRTRPDGLLVNALTVAVDGTDARVRVADPGTNVLDVANKGYVDTADTILGNTKLSLDGTSVMTGNIDLGGFKVINSAVASAGTDVLSQDAGDARYVTQDISSNVNDAGSVVLRVSNDTGDYGTISNAAGLEIFQATSGRDAFQTFHVSGDYAVQFGLDGTTNDLFVGGWSMGATKHKVWHAGNDGPTSGLYAQTANYANSAGSSNDQVKFPRNLGTGSRVYNSTYYNGSPYSKYLMVRGRNFNDWRGYVQCTISRSGYSTVTSALQSYAGNADYQSGGFWVIPPYSYYIVKSTATVGGAHLAGHFYEQWVEWY